MPLAIEITSSFDHFAQIKRVHNVLFGPLFPWPWGQFLIRSKNKIGRFRCPAQLLTLNQRILIKTLTTGLRSYQAQDKQGEKNNRFQVKICQYTVQQKVTPKNGADLKKGYPFYSNILPQRQTIDTQYSGKDQCDLIKRSLLLQI